jgi:hypothetical protein
MVHRNLSYRGMGHGDFMVSVTASMRVLLVFVAMEVGSRRILHSNVTAHPTAVAGLPYQPRSSRNLPRLVVSTPESSLQKRGIVFLSRFTRSPRSPHAPPAVTHN